MTWSTGVLPVAATVPAPTAATQPPARKHDISVIAAVRFMAVRIAQRRPPHAGQPRRLRPGLVIAHVRGAARQSPSGRGWARSSNAAGSYLTMSTRPSASDIGAKLTD